MIYVRESQDCRGEKLVVSCDEWSLQGLSHNSSSSDSTDKREMNERRTLDLRVCGSAPTRAMQLSSPAVRMQTLHLNDFVCAVTHTFIDVTYVSYGLFRFVDASCIIAALSRMYTCYVL